ncbi:S24 family peptidase [Nostocoides sp.]|uniref:S24 family peptidase n=1 Tax=Nostocoides sp. TaxID=1917966 RepID=UPI003BB076C1
MPYLPFRFRLVQVAGHSMEPTLCPGDLLLVRVGAPVRPDRIAVVQLPPDAHGQPRPVAVKRVTGHDPADPTRWWVERDNPRVGVDSWLVGSLHPTEVLAIAVMRLWPRPRRV